MAQNVIIRGVTYTGVEKMSFPISGGSALFRDTSAADAAASDIVRGKTAYGANGLITGTHDLPSGGISITQNGTVDVTDYATALVNVQGGGGAVDLVDINFSRAVESFTAQGVSVDPTVGATFGTTSAYLIVPCCAAGRELEIDVVSMSMLGTANKRFIMPYKSSADSGLVWRHANLEWGFYNGNAWQMSGIADMNYFDGSTVKATVDSSNKWHFYRNGVVVFEPTLSLAPSSLGAWCIGGQANSCYGAIISAVRVR